MKKTFLALGLLLGFLGISVVSSQKAYAKEVDFQTHITSEQEDEAEVIYKFTTRKIFDETHATYEVEDKNEDKTYLVAFAKDEFKYVCSSAGLNLRSFPNILYDNIEKTVPYGTELKVIASSKTGWAIVKFEDNKYFCWEPSLSYEKPEPKPEVPTIVYVEELELESESTIETQETILNTIEEVEVETEAPTCSCAYYTADQLKNMGVIHWNGWRWTWYSQRILPGEGLVIPGRHVDENGYICDENDYICLAASSLSKGSIVDTPFGKLGKVYDCGCAYGTLDVYTDF